MLVLFLAGVFTASLKAQDHAIAHETQYFVKLKKHTKESEVNDALSTLNSVEIWNGEETDMRLWAVNSFPFTFNGEEIHDLETLAVQIKKNKKTKKIIKNVELDQLYQVDSDVDVHLARSKKKTKIEAVVESIVGEEQFFLLNQQNAIVGDNTIKIAILDTGISDEVMSQYYGGAINYTGIDHIDIDYHPNDQNGHGTQVAGLIYRILADMNAADKVEFDIRKTHDADGVGTISKQVAAIVGAVRSGAHIINMSFSHYEWKLGKDFLPLQEAIAYAEANGVLVVAAAGNRNLNIDKSKFVPVPGGLPNDNVVTVASNDVDGALSSFSNYGSASVDVSILGEGISGYDLNGNEIYVSGTSFSTAIISSLAAVIGTRQSEFDANEVKCALIDHTLASPEMASQVYAGGRVDLFEIAYQPVIGCADGYLTAKDAFSGNNSLSSQDYSVAKTQNPLHDIRVFPNPAHQSVQLDLNQLSGQSATIAVTDPIGSRILHIEIPADHAPMLDLSMEGWSNGIYNITVYPKNGKLVSKKLVVLQ